MTGKAAIIGDGDSRGRGRVQCDGRKIRARDFKKNR